MYVCFKKPIFMKKKKIMLVAIKCKKFINPQMAKSQPEDATAQSSSIP
jgi:hypothetical protein